MKVSELIPVFVDFIPEQPEEGKLYISESTGFAVHLCACGCKGKTVTGLQPRWENGWQLKNNGDKITLRPCIGNWSGQSPYHAHYYITDNKIEWL